MPIKKKFQTPRFQSFHAIAASRGDGLYPELVQLLERFAKGADASLSEALEADLVPKNVAPDREVLKPQRQ